MVNIEVPSPSRIFPVCLLLLVFSCSQFSRMQSDKLSIRNMRCESQVEPIGIDVQRPRLSWELFSSERGQRQEGYRIIVSESPLLDQAVWDSGFVESPDSIQVEYAGSPLKSHKTYYWNVEVEGKHGCFHGGVRY